MYLYMNWYLAKIVFQIITEKDENIHQFDEQLRLIKAENKAEAFHKAKMLGIEETDSFLSKKGEKVDWKFLDVTELIELMALQDKMEIYSKIEEQNDVESYLKYIKNKRMGIEQDVQLEFVLQ